MPAARGVAFYGDRASHVRNGAARISDFTVVLRLWLRWSWSRGGLQAHGRHQSYSGVDCDRDDNRATNEVDEIMRTLNRRRRNYKQVQKERTEPQLLDRVESPHEQDRPYCVEARKGDEACHFADEGMLGRAQRIETDDLIGSHDRRQVRELIWPDLEKCVDPAGGNEYKHGERDRERQGGGEDVLLQLQTPRRNGEADNQYEELK